MKKSITIVGLLFLLLLNLTATAESDQYNDSLREDRVTAHNGAVTTAPAAHADVASDIDEKRVQEVAPGIYRIAGWGLSSTVAVEAPDGFIIVDSGDNIAFAREQRAALEAKVGHKVKVAAILYTHSHYVWGTTVWQDDGADVYAHEDLLPNLLADQGVSVLTGNFNTRAIIQFGMLHPAEGADAFPNHLGFSLAKLTGEKGFVPPTITFKDGEVESHTIAGMTVEALPSKIDVLDSMAYYFPAKKLLVTNAMVSSSVFNLYTLRGDSYRDPTRLVEAADLALSRDTDVHVDIHGPAHIGRDEARAALQRFRDTMQLIQDQTYSAIAAGKDAQEAAEWVYLPAQIRDDKETYGQVESHVRQVYNGRIGWMGWDVYDINPLTKADFASNVIDAMGGADAVLAAARKSNAREEIDGWQWSLYLTSELLQLDASNADVKAVRAEAARALGQRTTSANARGFYISEALLHEGKLAMGEQVISDYQQLSRLLGAVTAEKLAKSPLDDNVQYLRYLVDSRLAEGLKAEFNISFAEEDKRYAIALRNSVIAIGQEPNDGPTFELQKSQWDAMILGEAQFAGLSPTLSVIDQAIGRALTQ
jgi:alkyl sulfatase BDS1-like metallo-beta-lactamase superfamily hydrolase